VRFKNDPDGRYEMQVMQTYIDNLLGNFNTRRRNGDAWMSVLDLFVLAGSYAEFAAADIVEESQPDIETSEVTDEVLI
jgi:hypothetical protein